MLRDFWKSDGLLTMHDQSHFIQLSKTTEPGASGRCKSTWITQGYTNHKHHMTYCLITIHLYLDLSVEFCGGFSSFKFYRIFSFFLWYWGLKSGLCTCKTGACKESSLQLEPYLPLILLWLFWRWGLAPGLASNRNPPDLSLPSS
jgi:hypothetical protein